MSTTRVQLDCSSLDAEIRSLRSEVLTAKPGDHVRDKRRGILALVEEREARFGRVVRTGRDLGVHKDILVIEVLDYRQEKHIILLRGSELAHVRLMRGIGLVTHCPNWDGMRVCVGAPGSSGLLEQEEQTYWLRLAVRAALNWRAGRSSEKLEELRLK